MVKRIETIRRAVAGAVMVLFIGTLPAAAQQKQDEVGPREGEVTPVIGVVDVQEVLRDSAAAKGVREAAEAKAQQLEAQLQRQREDLKTREQQLRQQQTILAPDAFNEKRQELERYVADLRRQHEQQRAQMNQVFSDAMNQLREELRKVVVIVMEQKGVAMTLPRSAVLIFDERMNITKEVTALLNERVPKVPVNFDAPPPKPTAKR